MLPWPGKILPVSLILAFLFKYEIKRSPNWLTKEINKLKIMPYKSNSISKWSNLVKRIIGIKLKTKDPIDPEIVWFGLILVNFFPPITFPKI